LSNIILNDYNIAQHLTTLTICMEHFAKSPPPLSFFVHNGFLFHNISNRK
jgi:hypothetical protein